MKIILPCSNDCVRLISDFLGSISKGQEILTYDVEFDFKKIFEFVLSKNFFVKIPDRIFVFDFDHYKSMQLEKRPCYREAIEYMEMITKKYVFFEWNSEWNVVVQEKREISIEEFDSKLLVGATYYNQTNKSYWCNEKKKFKHHMEDGYTWDLIYNSEGEIINLSVNIACIKDYKKDNREKESMIHSRPKEKTNYNNRLERNEYRRKAINEGFIKVKVGSQFGREVWEWQAICKKCESPLKGDNPEEAIFDQETHDCIPTKKYLDMRKRDQRRNERMIAIIEGREISELEEKWLEEDRKIKEKEEEEERKEKKEEENIGVKEDEISDWLKLLKDNNLLARGKKSLIIEENKVEDLIYKNQVIEKIKSFSKKKDWESALLQIIFVVCKRLNMDATELDFNKIRSMAMKKRMSIKYINGERMRKSLKKQFFGRIRYLFMKICEIDSFKEYPSIETEEFLWEKDKKIEIEMIGDLLEDNGFEFKLNLDERDKEVYMGEKTTKITKVVEDYRIDDIRRKQNFKVSIIPKCDEYGYTSYVDASFSCQMCQEVVKSDVSSIYRLIKIHKKSKKHTDFIKKTLNLNEEVIESTEIVPYFDFERLKKDVSGELIEKITTIIDKKSIKSNLEKPKELHIKSGDIENPTLLSFDSGTFLEKMMEEGNSKLLKGIPTVNRKLNSLKGLTVRDCTGMRNNITRSINKYINSKQGCLLTCSKKETSILMSAIYELDKVKAKDFILSYLDSICYNSKIYKSYRI